MAIRYGAALERQELALAYGDGAFIVRYHEDWLPIAPDTYGTILSNGLDAWVAGDPRVDPADVEELRSIINATEHLPPRGGRDTELIAIRAREKEVVKRRLAVLVDRSPSVRDFVVATIARFNGTAGDAASFNSLDDLLNRQSYRLAHWRVASEEINYRRFFDVNQLAALRMEDEAVFDCVHRFVLELVARGATTGLRVDHVDGLFAPGEYLRRLQEKAAAALGAPSNEARPLYLVAEKILGADERLAKDWPVHGTTGYEFASIVNGLFVDSRHERPFSDIYARFLRAPRRSLSFDDLVYQSKKAVMHETMSGDINSLGHQLNRFSEQNRHFRDFTLYSLISTLKEVIACFPVYRTYLTEGGPVTEHDRRYVGRAIACAKRTQGTAPIVCDFVEQLLLGNASPSRTPDQGAEQMRFVGKFQQITSPVAAKGIEDTALYIYNRLLSLNEVGSDPKRFGLDPPSVHRAMAERQRVWPLALSATSTHDTKRGEDVRARLNVLSELPTEWKNAVSRWRAINRRFKRDVRGIPVPAPNEEYFLYQTLVGGWPFAEEDEPAFAERLRAYLVKAAREAKTHTSWLAPDEEYEAALLSFADAILDPERPFLRAFRPFQARIAELGIYNSLAQLVIKVTAPGVPDFYQGTELWELSFVDPDNRRPVDYERRASLLAGMPAGACRDAARALLAARTDGRIKLYTTRRALAVRSRMRRVFEEGDYVALQAEGPSQDSIFAFARAHAEGVAVTCVPRLVAGKPSPVGAANWVDSRVILPPALHHQWWRDAFTGAVHESKDGVLEAASLFDLFPIALLTPSENERSQ